MARPSVRGSVAVIGDWEDGVGAILLRDVDFTDEGCWLRTTGIDSKWGTSRRDFRGVKGESAHRVAHELWIGSLGKDQRVIQFCERRACVNPFHLAIMGSEEANQWRLLKGLERYCDCKIWMGYCNPAGYGEINIRGNAVLTHRYAWEVRYGPIPDGMEVCHHCDNPPCCEPSHLFIGPHEKNLADMAWKERSGVAKLTVDTARQIRERYSVGNVSLVELAIEHGVSKRTVLDTVKGKKWLHAGGPLNLSRFKPNYCRKGHELTEQNTIRRHDGSRQCRECSNKCQRDRYRRNR